MSIMGIYHRADLDGHCCAAIMKKRYCSDISLIGIDYGDVIPWGYLTDHTVIVADFSLQPFAEMERLHKIALDVVWIDHHKTAIDAAAKSAVEFRGIRENGTAACRLLWRWLFPNEEEPTAVWLLGRYDVWDLDEGVLDFQYGMRAEEKTQPLEGKGWFDLWNQLLDGDDSLVANKLREGRIVRNYQKKQNKNACENAQHIKFHGLHCIALNIAGANSKVFESLWNNEVLDAMLAYHYNPIKGWKVSMFTDREGIDVSEVAKAHGGGGHAKAAGFYMKDCPINDDA